MTEMKRKEKKGEEGRGRCWCHKMQLNDIINDLISNITIRVHGVSSNVHGCDDL